MARDTDHLAGSFETENTGGLLTGFLAEEDEFDRRALWRLGSWGAAAVGAVIVARARQPVLDRIAARAGRGRRSGAAGPADPVGRQGKPERDAAAGLRHRYPEQRSRPAVFPRHRAGTGPGFGDRRDCAAKSPPRRPPQPLRQLAASRQPHRPATLRPPAAAHTAAADDRRPRPDVSRRRRRPNDRGGARSQPEAGDGRGNSREASDVAPDAGPRRLRPQPAPPNRSSDAGDAADGIEIDDGAARSAAGKADRTGRRRRSTVASARRCRKWSPRRSPPDDAGSGRERDRRPRLPSSEPNSGSISAAPIRSAACARCGAGLLKSKSNAPLAALRPIIVVKEGSNGLGMQLRLVAGPLSDAAAAAKICAALIESERPCETTVFDGQRLAMKADEPQPPPPSRAPRKRGHRQAAGERGAAPRSRNTSTAVVAIAGKR